MTGASRSDTATATYTVADATVDALRHNGVDVVFGIGGTHTLPLLGAIERSDLTFVSTRTELGAAYMAVGYARASGRTAVALTSTGPGALNAISALQDAQWSSLPLIHLTTAIGGEPGAGFAGEVHETPVQHELLRLAGKDCLRLSPADPHRAIGSAIRLAHEHPRGPVTIEIPAGSWPASATRPTGAGARAAEPPPAGGTGLAELTEALRTARRPVFFVGGGALAHDGGRAVLDLAEHLHAPMVASYQGKTVADRSHPLYLGPWASESAVRDVVGQADVAVVFGSKLSALGTAAWQLPLPATTYRIDLNGRAHPRYPRLRELPADAAAVATGLRAELDPKQPWAPSDVRAEITEGARSRSELAMRYVDALGAPELFAADMSKAGFWAMKFLSTRAPAVQAFSSYLAMGTALPMAVGMTIARRRPAVVVIGDGGLQMSLSELATIAEYRLPVSLVVIVDGAYGMLRDNSVAVGGSTDLGLTLWNPDLARLGAAFGIPHADVHSPEQLESILASGVDGPRLLLVHDTFPRNW
jgi:acetolactate synthase-1/2/3 large subunit